MTERNSSLRHKIEDNPLFWLEIENELSVLADIMRDHKYQDICEASGHILLLCTGCNKDQKDALRRIDRYKEGISRQSS